MNSQTIDSFYGVFLFLAGWLVFFYGGRWLVRYFEL